MIYIYFQTYEWFSCCNVFVGWETHTLLFLYSNWTRQDEKDMCNITGTTLCPPSFSAIDFVFKYEIYLVTNWKFKSLLKDFNQHTILKLFHFV